METSPITSPGTAPNGSGTDWVITKCESAHCVKVRENIDGTVSIGSTTDTTILTITRGEWDAFVAGAQAGDFDL